MVYPELVRMKAAGFNVWYNVDQGNEWPEEVAVALLKAAIFVFFISPRSIASTNCRNEAYLALGEGKPFVSVHLEETDLKSIGPDLSQQIGSKPALLKYQEDYWRKFQNILRDFLSQQPVDQSPEALLASELGKVVTELKLRPGAQILDLMTGGGQTAVFMAKKNFTVTAADPVYSNLLATADLANSHQLAITLKQHGAEPLPYPDNSFSLICIRDRVHMLNDPEAFIREAYRCMRIYGYLMVVDHVIPDDQVEADQWLNTLERLRDPSFVRYYTPTNWRKWCVRVGLTVAKLQVEPEKQGDLDLYLSQTNVTEENRKKIMEMVTRVPAPVRDLFKVKQEDGKIVWQYRRMLMLAGKI